MHAALHNTTAFLSLFFYIILYIYNMYAAICYAFNYFRHINMPDMMKRKIIEILLLRKFRNEITLRQSVCFLHHILESTNQSVSQCHSFWSISCMIQAFPMWLRKSIQITHTHTQINTEMNIAAFILCIRCEFWCLSRGFDWMKVNDDATKWKSCLFSKNIRFHGHTVVHWVFVLVQAFDSAYYTNEQKNIAI